MSGNGSGSNGNGNGKALFYGHLAPDGRRSANRKTYDIKRLWERNQEIINLAVLGTSQQTIAETLGVCPATVSNTLNSTLGKLKLSSMRVARDEDTWDAAKKIQELAKKSLEFYESILGDEIKDSDGRPAVPISTKVAVARHVTNDLSGLRAPTKVEGRFAHAYLTTEDIERLKEQGRNAAKEMGTIVEHP